MPRRSLLLSLLAAVAAITTLAATTPDGTSDRSGAIIDVDEHDCEQFTPQRTSISGVTDEGQNIDLDVRVLLDVGAAQDIALDAEAAETDAERQAVQQRFDALVADIEPRIAAVAESYGPLDIEVIYTYELFTPYSQDGSLRDRESDPARNAREIIDLAKHQYGGARPADVDIVYVITDLDIFAAGVGNIVAGMADCIGGVAWADTAFAVGEIFPAIPIGPVEFYREGTAKVLAHEVGHLMGAHHHYQSCGAEAAHEIQQFGFGACSLMTNAVDFQTTQFSLLSHSVVRAHAVDFAQD